MRLKPASILSAALFPPDVLAERAKVFQEIENLLLLRTVAAADQAVTLHRAWAEQHPHDYMALDYGSDINRLRDAIIVTETPSADRSDAGGSQAAVG